MPARPSTEPKKVAILCAAEAEAKKAENVKILQVTEFTSIADYFVICTVKSEIQLKTLASWLEQCVRTELAVKPLSSEGDPASRWVVIDFGATLVHIMTEDMRERYQLESLWGDAPRVDAVKRLENMANPDCS